MLIPYEKQRLFGINEAQLNNIGEIELKSLYHARLILEDIKRKISAKEQKKVDISAPEFYYIHLFQKISRDIIEFYEKNILGGGLKYATSYLYEKLGEEEVKGTFLELIKTYPPLEVIKRQLTPEEYLIENGEKAVELLIVVSLTAKNPALKRYSVITGEIESIEKLEKTFVALRDFFTTQPPIKNQNLVEFLEKPVVSNPESIKDQIKVITTDWQEWIVKYEQELLRCLDAIKEHETFRGAGHGEVALPSYEIIDGENYAPDRSWMSQVVLLAKNVYVWLYQLSRKYNKEITTLDQIPEEELKYLASLGFNAIWLIGVWERSLASKKIKNMTGNPEAEASAYAVVDYVIATKLGGEKAFIELKRRARKHGLRLGCDMVPNHTAIDGEWVYQHPDWFIQLDHSPFPSYSFNGPNLSQKPEIGIFLEDHYYDRTDAAVVFKWVDYKNNEERYIYHGNDGTNMPWNDTAQLNYLKKEVREAVIKKILDVADLFHIIRFDAAMTLTKFHYQRLWFPEPGKGGAIPSRAEYGLTKEQFDQLMPKEFWRDVVDIVVKEKPEVLLIAEAFWLLEGYFVRTLGMHRVYNSAFMHMLRDEKNAQYRELIKKTLDFDPEILKRYVNFMSNPDEETAIKQFGKQDKYFGVCTLMATLPGLPMFAHGQIEGFAEKYGMEYARAYWDEEEDKELIANHKKIITPLLKKRYLFSEIENFVFYDVVDDNGNIIEDIFAYSNEAGSEKALVVYNNKFKEYRATIKMSVTFLQKTDSDKKIRIKKSLAEALHLSKGNATVYFRDILTGKEYSIPSKELWEKGLKLELKAYEYHVFVEFKED